MKKDRKESNSRYFQDLKERGWQRVSMWLNPIECKLACDHTGEQQLTKAIRKLILTVDKSNLTVDNNCHPSSMVITPVKDDCFDWLDDRQKDILTTKGGSGDLKEAIVCLANKLLALSTSKITN